MGIRNYQAQMDCRKWRNEITDEVWEFIGGEIDLGREMKQECEEEIKQESDEER